MGGVCISLVGKNPKDDQISKTKNLKFDLTTLKKKISSRLKNFYFLLTFFLSTFFLFDILSAEFWGAFFLHA